MLVPRRVADDLGEATGREGVAVQDPAAGLRSGAGCGGPAASARGTPGRPRGAISHVRLMTTAPRTSVSRRCRRAPRARPDRGSSTRPRTGRSRRSDDRPSSNVTARRDRDGEPRAGPLGDDAGDDGPDGLHPDHQRVDADDAAAHPAGCQELHRRVQGDRASTPRPSPPTPRPMGGDDAVGRQPEHDATDAEGRDRRGDHPRAEPDPHPLAGADADQRADAEGAPQDPEPGAAESEVDRGGSQQRLDRRGRQREPRGDGEEAQDRRG